MELAHNRALGENEQVKHTVIYRWRIKEGRVDEFRAAWAEGTREIRETCGSGGAELFSGPDGLLFSLARWPSPAHRSACFKSTDMAEAQWGRTMQDCVAERLPELPLEQLEDLRKSDKTKHLVPTLQTDRLTLRPLALDDAECLWGALRYEANMCYWGRGPLESVEAVREYIAWNVDSIGVECFAITETKALAKALGWVILMDRGQDQAEIGFILRPDAQGRGIAREAIAEALVHGFTTRCIQRIYADIDPDNAKSIAAITASGFSYEGRLRATWNTHLGVRDSLIYSRLHTD